MEPKPGALIQYKFDLSMWPIAVAITPPGVPGSEIDLDHFYAQIDRLLARRQLFATVQDLTGASPFDPKRRARFAQFLQERGDSIRKYMVANAVVVDNAMLRGVVTAVLWVTPSPCPYRVFPTRDSALEWCRSMYQEASATANVG